VLVSQLTGSTWVTSFSSIPARTPPLSPPITCSSRGHTCLHCASARSNGAAVQLLLGLGCDLLRSDKSGRTALHHAAAAGSEECVRLLLAAAEEAEEARATAAVAVVVAALPGEDGEAAPMVTSAAPSRSSSPQPQSGGQQQQAQQHQHQHQQQFLVGTVVSRWVAATDHPSAWVLLLTSLGVCRTGGRIGGRPESAA
jgi:ankyrin repeat protein